MSSPTAAERGAAAWQAYEDARKAARKAYFVGETAYEDARKAYVDAIRAIEEEP